MTASARDAARAAAPGPARLAVVEAAAWLGVAAFAVRFLPFRWLAPRLGARGGVAEGTEGGGAGGDAAGRAAARGVSVGHAVTAAAQRVPWRSTCLARCVAAKAMLRRRGLASTLYLGVDHGPTGALQAHAWLRCGGAVVAGDPEVWRYAVVATFAEPGR